MHCCVRLAALLLLAAAAPTKGFYILTQRNLGTGFCVPRPVDESCTAITLLVSVTLRNNVSLPLCRHAYASSPCREPYFASVAGAGLAVGVTVRNALPIAKVLETSTRVRVDAMFCSSCSRTPINPRDATAHVSVVCLGEPPVLARNVNVSFGDAPNTLSMKVFGNCTEDAVALLIVDSSMDLSAEVSDGNVSPREFIFSSDLREECTLSSRAQDALYDSSGSGSGADEDDESATYDDDHDGRCVPTAAATAVAPTTPDSAEAGRAVHSIGMLALATAWCAVLAALAATAAYLGMRARVQEPFYTRLL